MSCIAALAPSLTRRRSNVSEYSAEDRGMTRALAGHSKHIYTLTDASRPQGLELEFSTLQVRFHCGARLARVRFVCKEACKASHPNNLNHPNLR
jgi:hypothetical protein